MERSVHEPVMLKEEFVTPVCLQCIDNDKLLGIAENMSLTRDGKYVLTIAAEKILIQKVRAY